MTTDNFDFRDFIGKNSLSTLGSCATIVGFAVQGTKELLPLHPLALSFLFAFLLSIVKLILSNDYTKENVLLSIINTLPIALTASGGYDLLTKISIQ